MGVRPDMGIAVESRLVRVTTPSRDSLLGELEGRLKARQGFAVATLNLDHIVKLRRDADFRAAYARQTHIVADGNPVVWLQRLAGRPAELITGADLIEPLMDLAAQQKVPVAFFGATQEALDVASERLAERCPGLEIVARVSPAFGFDPQGSEADAGIVRLAASGACLCLVALGAPKQEIFVARAAEQLPGCGFVSIGAGLDFIAGTQTRAPELVRRLALEWLWRLANDRRRLARRYFDCALILPGLTLAALRERFGAPVVTGQVPPAQTPQTEPVEE